MIEIILYYQRIREVWHDKELKRGKLTKGANMLYTICYHNSRDILICVIEFNRIEYIRL